MFVLFSKEITQVIVDKTSYRLLLEDVVLGLVILFGAHSFFRTAFWSSRSGPFPINVFEAIFYMLVPGARDVKPEQQASASFITKGSSKAKPRPKSQPPQSASTKSKNE